MILVASLAAPLADGAPGDLDPAFGDAGRVEFEDIGPVWSLELDDDGGGLLAGGDYYYCWYYDDCVSSFTHPFSSSGAPDLDYTHPDLPGTLIVDTARQPDGKLVGVGSTRQGSSWQLTVFRLLHDGALDPIFGDGGIIHFTDAASVFHTGNSVVLESDGRIVVAGSRGNELLLLRLLENGALDEAFGDAGVVVGPENVGTARLAAAPDGGYRVTTLIGAGDTAEGSGCRVVALAADGTLDSSFGTGGSVDVTASAYCLGLEFQSDGRLLVAGSVGQGSDTSGLLVRLLPDGSPDDTFSAPAVVQAMSRATALALDADGNVLVAGRGPSGTAGALVTRLSADGVLDTSYGNVGTTWIDVPAAQAQVAIVNDMAVGADGSLTVAGSYGDFPAPFAARLMGDGSADAAGIVSMTRPTTPATEDGAQAVVTVRRAGGQSGALSVAYRTAPFEGGASDAASPGADYEEVTGHLSWGDGDMTEREIAIPIGADDSTPEGFESFWLRIDSLQGGADFGGRATRVEIAADGAPAGQFIIQPGQASIREGQTAELWVERAYYGAGEVSVTVAPSGTATAGADYEMSPTVLTWGEGEMGPKAVQITVRADGVDETPAEELILTLTDPTGGAIIGASTSTSMSIVDAGPEGGDSGRSSGGGSLGWASLLALCAAGVLRFARSPRVRARHESA
jgi:uncharacterized delta-60 repeat protein